MAIRATTSGTQYSAMSVSFTEPWLGGSKPNNFSVSFYRSVYDYSEWVWRRSDDYFRIIGGAIGLGTRLKWPDDYFTLYTEFSYQNYKLRNWKQDFLFTNGMANNMSVRFVLGRNSVDQPIYPRTGSNFSLSLQLTPPYSYFNGKDYTSPTMTAQERYRVRNGIPRLLVTLCFTSMPSSAIWAITIRMWVTLPLKGLIWEAMVFRATTSFTDESL